jgi:hypothetical protein
MHVMRVQELWHLSFEMQPSTATSVTSHDSSDNSSSSSTTSTSIGSCSSNIVVLNRSAPSVYLHGPVEVSCKAIVALLINNAHVSVLCAIKCCDYHIKAEMRKDLHTFCRLNAPRKLLAHVHAAIRSS